MNSPLVPFNFSAGAQLPVRRVGKGTIVSDVVVGVEYPSISIRGKVFALVEDGVRKVLTQPGDPDSPLSAIDVIALRINGKSRTYYAGEYSDGQEGVRPTCFSNDGVKPAGDAETPQCATCQLCPHAVFGSARQGRGAACRNVARAAVVHPSALDKPYLMRIPITSMQDRATKRGLRNVVEQLDSCNVDYNEVVLRATFDPEAASPKLLWKPIQYIQDADFYARVKARYHDPLVLEIAGQDAPAANAPAVEPKPHPAPQPAPAAAPAPKPAAKKAPKPQPAPAQEVQGLGAAVAGDDEQDDALAEVETYDVGRPFSAPGQVAAAPVPESKPEPLSPSDEPEGDSGNAVLALTSDLDALLGGFDD